MVKLFAQSICDRLLATKDKVHEGRFFWRCEISKCDKIQKGLF